TSEAGTVSHATWTCGAAEIAALPADLATRTSLPIGERVSPCIATEPVCGIPIRVRRTAAMGWIVLPFIPTATEGVAAIAAAEVPAISAEWIDAVAATEVSAIAAAADVVIAVEIIVDVDIDIATTPTAAPSPATSPRKAHCDSDSE